MTVEQLQCAVQHYAWGKLGNKSIIAQLLAVEDCQKPYAELWMGTHDNAPARIANSGQLLKEFLKEKHREYLGQYEHHYARSKRNDSMLGELPFLFKVLSVRTALSIQCHPDRHHAQILHAQQPDVYRDPHHKPEIACALTEFEALAAFRRFEVIAQMIQQQVPELRSLLQEQLALNAQDFDHLLHLRPCYCAAHDCAGHKCEQATETPHVRRNILKRLFSALMKCPSDKVTTYLRIHIERLQQKQQQAAAGQTQQEQLTADEKLVLRLYEQYPDDVGCFTVYFLNYVTLQPGECMFMGPDEPHAYLSGDLMECMACSDNVIRAGLTPKYRDVDNLCNLLTYRDDSLEKNMMMGRGEELSPFVRLFCPPDKFPEFQLYRIELGKDSTISADQELVKLISAGILIIIEADEEVSLKIVPDTQGASVRELNHVHRGQVFVIANGATIVTPVANDGRRLLAFLATCNVHALKHVHDGHNHHHSDHHHDNHSSH